jgi:hypothetical protein
VWCSLYLTMICVFMCYVYFIENDVVLGAFFKRLFLKIFFLAACRLLLLLPAFYARARARAHDVLCVMWHVACLRESSKQPLGRHIERSASLSHLCVR